MEDYFAWYSLTDARKLRIAKMTLQGAARQYWNSMEEQLYQFGRPPVTLWDEMKLKLREQYVPTPATANQTLPTTGMQMGFSRPSNPTAPPPNNGPAVSTNARIECFHCHAKGHIASRCPRRTLTINTPDSELCEIVEPLEVAFPLAWLCMVVDVAVTGCTYVVQSFMEYSVNRSKVIWSLVEAIDVYLLGTVMLVFGMGLYELFISNLDIVKSSQENKPTDRSNLLGMFMLKERPKWLDITTVNELKTKLGHVIVMLLLIGLFEKSKKAVIQSPFDLLCFSACVLLSSGCLFLLSKLNE
ncbi:unnamed protein product [Prunus brigantina]